MTSTTLNATLVESGTLKNARDFQTVTFTLINISCVIRPSYFESYDVVVETIYAVLQYNNMEGVESDKLVES